MLLDISIHPYRQRIHSFEEHYYTKWIQHLLIPKINTYFYCNKYCQRPIHWTRQKCSKKFNFQILSSFQEIHWRKWSQLWLKRQLSVCHTGSIHVLFILSLVCNKDTTCVVPRYEHNREQPMHYFKTVTKACLVIWRAVISTFMKQQQISISFTSSYNFIMFVTVGHRVYPRDNLDHAP